MFSLLIYPLRKGYTSIENYRRQAPVSCTSGCHGEKIGKMVYRTELQLYSPVGILKTNSPMEVVADSARYTQKQDSTSFVNVHFSERAVYTENS